MQILIQGGLIRNGFVLQINNKNVLFTSSNGGDLALCGVEAGEGVSAAARDRFAGGGAPAAPSADPRPSTVVTDAALAPPTEEGPLVVV